jgi:hypothetical protein
MLEPIPESPHQPAEYVPVPGGAPSGPGHASCPDCASRAHATPQQFVYALGHIEVRFPTLGLEREYQQRERMLPPAPGKPHLERVREVLVHNLHLAAQACYLLSIGGSPAYLLAPAGNYLRPSLFDAIGSGDSGDSFAVVVGRLGPMAPPQACGGVLVPVLLCDQIYTFRLGEWQAALTTGLQAALDERKIDQEQFGEAAKGLFRRIVQSTENVGATDVHRALNYLVMQHPGIFLLAAEKRDRHQLDRIDTRLVQGPSARRQVAVILSFVERSTGVVERYFTRVDITEEWPFVSDAEGGRGAIGLSPYLENSMLGMPL